MPSDREQTAQHFEAEVTRGKHMKCQKNGCDAISLAYAGFFGCHNERSMQQIDSPCQRRRKQLRSISLSFIQAVAVMCLFKFLN